MMRNALSAGTPAAESSTCFHAARRINQSLTAGLERRMLIWMAEHAPRWLTSDQLTLLGFAAQLGAGAGYALARWRRGALWIVIVCTILNWMGDSLDGTLARVRQQQRPRYGFYVDHIVDMLGSAALLAGLGASGMVHWQVALSMLAAFLLLSGESYLATYTLGTFQLSQGVFGPTELRILLIAGDLALLHSPYATVFGHRWLLLDIGGMVATICMAAMVLALAARHTAQLYREEPLP